MPFGDGTGPDGRGPRGYWCPYYVYELPPRVPIRMGLGRRRGRGFRGGR